MSERARSGLGAVLVAFVMTAAMGGCDAFYQVRGKVRSCLDHQPIAGADVRLTYPGERGAATTDETGTFRVAANDPPGDDTATLSQDVCLQPAKDPP